jgi:hypothetical protein
VFTDSQMYFQCLEMHCLEGLHFDPKTAVLGPPASSLHFSPNSHRALPLGSINWNIKEFHTQLCTEYFQRELRFPQDALNAFEGVLGAFRDSKADLCAGHFWGIPIFTRHGETYVTPGRKVPRQRETVRHMPTTSRIDTSDKPY